MSDFIPVHSQYANIGQRLRTFVAWPGDTTPHQMATAGFIYEGHLDVVRCFSCDIRIAAWETVYNPVERHAYMNPECSFILGKYGPAFINKVWTNESLVYSPKHPDYYTYHFLLQTFRPWGVQNAPRPVQMAAAGFFFQGNTASDAVKCYFCGGRLINWNLQDDPMKIHAKFFPNCSWVNRRFSVETIRQLCSQNNYGVSCRYF